MPTISRRLASAGTADPGDLKSPSLPGASPGSPTNFGSRVADLGGRRVVHREQQTDSTQDRTALGVQVSPRRPAFALSGFGSAGQFGMSTGQADRASVLTSACLRA